MITILKHLKATLTCHMERCHSTFFLCNAVERRFNTDSRYEFEEYLIKNYPGKCMYPLSQFKTDRVPVFTSNDSRLKWINKHIKKLEKINNK